MSVPEFYNEITNQWEPIVTSDRLPIIDLGKNYDSDNLEGALQEIAKWKNDIGSGSLGLLGERMDKAESEIEWLKVHGGGGGSGAVAPTITSTIPENTEIKLNTGDKLDIPIIFSSANLGQGICYIMIDNVEVNTQTIKQGSNTINVGIMSELKSTLTLYAKDRAGLVSNSLTWTVINGGIELDVRFDSTADYTIGTEIIVPYYITTGSTKQLTANITIDYDKKTVKCSNGYNDYSITGLGVGIHTVKIQVTDGEYDSPEVTFNIIVIDSSKLYLTTDFDNSDQTYGVPISINYRISYGETDKFPVNLYLDDTLYKELESPRGNYYWVIDERLAVGSHKYKIELINGSETLKVEGTFKVVQGEYTPVELAQNGLIYRLNPSTRTNTDKDRASCVINGYQTDLHNFNFSSNGWIDGELVCNTGSYVEIDFKPYLSNATSGSTVEIYFKSFDTGNDNAMVIDYRDENTDKGFYIGLNECGLFSESNSGISFVCPDRYIKVSFVIDRFNKFAKIYIDGILSRAFKLTDSGSGVATIYENFAHNGKMYINYNTRDQSEGYCIIKDIVAYRRALTDDEIVKNGLFYETDIKQQQLDYNFEFNNTSLPQIRMYASKEEISKMTLEHKITMRIKYTSTNTEKYGQSFDLPYCQVGWQGTSSIAYVLKNYQVYLKDENMADYFYTPYPNGIPESTFCFKADYMESSHSRNVGLARLATDIIFADVKNPSQQENPKVRNSIDGFPVLLYINDELKGVYNFNTDRYSYKAWGYTDEDKTLSYEISANSDSTAGAFFPYDESSGTTELNYYKSDFMPIYPPTRVAGNDNYNEIKRLVDYVGKAEEDNFKDNFDKYFNREYVFRYLIFVHLFGLVDNLGKNARLTTWDGLIWWFQPYDCDTCIALDNSGFQKFDSDIEIGDKNVFNTTSSKLWSKVMLYFPNEIKQMYAQLRNGKLNLDNVLKYLIDEQLKKIPATMFNRDAQTKYLNFGETYLYACHGSSENLIKKWMSDRFKYMDSLYGYDTDNMDFITIRSSKMGKVYIDVQTFSPMYFTIKWRNEADNSGIKRQRIGKGETVRFEYKMPTETDQEIILYGGSNIKDLGDLSNLQPTTISIGNATRLTNLVCHSSNLVNTDLSSCTNLVHIDLSKCTQLGSGVGSQSVLNLAKNPNLLYLNCQDTQITSVNLDPLGSNIQELWLSKTIRSFGAQNCCALKVLGLQYGHNCKSIKLINCPELKSFGNNQWDPINKRYKYPDAYFLAGIEELYLDEAYDVEKIECLYNPNINNVTLRNLKNTKELTLGPRILIGTDTVDVHGNFRTVYPTQDNVSEYGDFKLTTKNCPNLESFRTRYSYGRNTYPTLQYADPLPGIEYLDEYGNTQYSKRHLQAGFHCNILDLSEVESLKRVDLGITSYINKLLIPSGVTFIRLNPLKDIPDKSPYQGYSANDMSPYYKYKYPYDTSYAYDMSGWGDWNRRGIRPDVIYSIAPTLEECETNVWKMGSYVLQDFDLGAYNVGESRDSSHLLTIQDLNLTCHDYSLVLPNLNSINDINGTVDMSNYTGNYLIRTFYGMTDNLQITLPNSYDNIKYVYDTVRELNTVQFDWKFGTFLFEKATNITAFFKNCKLKEQVDESEKVSFNNNSKSDGYWVGEENGIFVGANIKYIDEININSARCTQCMFDNNSSIISIGNVSIGGAKFTSASFDRIFRYMFKNAKNLTSVGNITIDLNNITWNFEDKTKECDGMFDGCSNLKTVGKISFTNVNPTQIKKTQSATDNLMYFSNMFRGCSSLTSDIDFDSGGILIGGLDDAFNSCSLVKNIKLPNLANTNYNLRLGGLCAGCSSLISIDFSRTGTFTATDKIYCRYIFSNCKSLTTITEGFDPDNMPEKYNSEEAYDYAFSNCQSLVPYYKLVNKNGRYCRRQTYYNCKSMNIPSNITIDRVVRYITTGWGPNCGDTFRLDPQITTATLNIRLSDEMKNASPDSDGYVNSYVLLAEGLFAGCNNLETLNINIEDLKPFKFKEGIKLTNDSWNDGNSYNLVNLKKVVFNVDLIENTKPNWMPFGNIMNGGKIEYVENYPLGVIGDDDISMSSNFKNITWKGQITTSYDKNYLKSTYMPQSCLNDFLMNHLGTAAENASINLGSNKSRASAEALAAATAKGWTIR